MLVVHAVQRDRGRAQLVKLLLLPGVDRSMAARSLEQRREALAGTKRHRVGEKALEQLRIFVELARVAIGQEQIKKLPQFIKMRRENAKTFEKLFNQHPHLMIQKELGQGRHIP